MLNGLDAFTVVVVQENGIPKFTFDLFDRHGLELDRLKSYVGSETAHKRMLRNPD